MRRVGVGLLGFGTVGQGVFRLLEENSDSICDRRGVKLEIAAIGVKSTDRPREIETPLLTDDSDAVVSHENVSIVIEAIGGLEPARSLLLKAIRSGKSVATANKALVATHGPELFDLAREYGVEFRFESTVCAGLPIIAALDRQLAANRVESMRGILNGTTNFVLTRMAQSGSSFEDALAEATALGYAEADPSSDVDGFDAAFKIAILASIASGKHFDPANVVRQGIRSISALDIQGAAALGGTVKLIAEWRADSDGGSASVEPMVVLPNSRFVEILGTENAVEVVGNAVGSVFFAGTGAGGAQTASGLVGDAIEIAGRTPGEPVVPHAWTVAPSRARRVTPTSVYAVFFSDSGPRAFESIERQVAPIRIQRFAHSVGESVAITEPTDRGFIAAIDQDGGVSGIRNILRCLS